MISANESTHGTPPLTPRKPGRRQALSLLAGAGCAWPALLRGASRRAGDKPNLLFLLTDQQRADTMAVYGNYGYRVPTMNRLASQSVVFHRCYVTQPLCTPSRSSLLTGLWPHTNGCVDNNIPLDPKFPTLPEILADASYRTAYFGKWHLGDELFPQRGFQEWISIEDGYGEHFSPGRPADAKSDYHRFLIRLGYKPDEPDGSFSRDFAAGLPIDQCKAAFLAGEASEFILRNRAQPWMLHVGFLEPHRPYEGPLNDLHSAEEVPVPRNYPGIPVDHEPRYYQRLRAVNREKGYDLSDPESAQRLNRNYAGLCSQVDRALGRILWSLEASGQADNTIVVLTSDHGELMGSHSLLAKMAMYEESVRVPFLLRVPFLRNSQLRVEQPVSNVSIVPTLLELLGQEVPERLPGRSLLPMLEHVPPKPADAVIEWNGPPGDPPGRAIVTSDGWKLALYKGDNCLLFNQTKDPLEFENLYYHPEFREVRHRLRRKIETWQGQTADRCPLPDD